MDSNRSRFGMLIGLGEAAGCFGVAAMMSAATAQTARADDLSDIINAVDGDFADGEVSLNTAVTEFGSNEPVLGLASFFDTVNDDSLSAPDNLLIGTVQALTNESVTGDVGWAISQPTDFTEALTDAEGYVTGSAPYFSDAATELASGDYGAAVYYDLFGADLLTVAPVEELLLGVAASF
jgi:hypothetical protein